eukprot:2561204-Pleurochrysis_carterae.AAC.1
MLKAAAQGCRQQTRWAEGGRRVEQREARHSERARIHTCTYHQRCYSLKQQRARNTKKKFQERAWRADRRSRRRPCRDRPRCSGLT